MSPGKPITAEIRDRIRDVATKEPELTRLDLAARFGVSESAISNALRGMPPKRRTVPAPETGPLFVAQCVCGWQLVAGRKRATAARRAHYSKHTGETRASTWITRSRA